MSVRAPHLQDDALLEYFYSTRRGEAVDPPSAEHLADCAPCSSRYAELGSFLSGLSEEADAEVSALFPPERLRAQQSDIARRLELVGRAARVITFPGRATTSSASSTGTGPVVRSRVTRMASRWIAVAAAAGLFVGVAAGTAFKFGPRVDLAREGRRSGTTAPSRQVTSSQSRLSPTAPDKAVKAVVADMDDMFMSDLEAVLDRPHTNELVAFDALTPHVREIRDLAR
jgi:hypothetical protein